MEFPKLSYSIPEAAWALGIGRSKVYELLSDGSLESFYIGKRRLVHRDDLEQFLARRRPPSAVA